eukprot:TRINITY_DN10869_c0_g1_i1.p1 TRINITY_DN10869_c0_g1~~TRINITY_DN10869_c0_g1_i1.p1  ORF type:complete len:311 (+),score=64.19 TRINITY_DN10869_c0_g1_i1:99-1031(+)
MEQGEGNPTDLSSLMDKYNKLKKEQEAVLVEMDEKFKVLSDMEKRINEEKKRREENLKDRVKLNIGGKKFETSKSTLLLIKNTYFSAMLSSGQWKPDEQGYFFIDRSPKHFAAILEYLRTGILHCDFTNELERQSFALELDYYQILLPVKKPKKLQWNSSVNSNHFQFLDGNATAVVRSQRLWNGVIGTEGGKSFAVRIGVSGAAISYMIGLIPKASFNPDNLFRYSTDSYIYHALDGSLISKNGFRESFMSAVAAGSTVRMFLDTSTRTISISLNGAAPVLAWQGVDNDDLYPAVWMNCAGAQVSFIDQ